MSKQSEAKAAQGYEPKPTPATCSNCKHFASEVALPVWVQRDKESGGKHWRGRAYSLELDGIEKNFRCGIGGFAVKKMATCAKFAPKAAK